MSNRIDWLGRDPNSQAGEFESPEIIWRLNVPGLFKLWQAHDPGSWSKNYGRYRAFATRALNLGEPLLAYDALVEGLKIWADDVRLRQLHALSLARSGATRRANSILMELRQAEHQDEETLGLLARTYKDLWLQSSDESVGLHNLRLAFELYLETFKIRRGYWPGINAATLALILGKSDLAKDIALEVSKLCAKELSQSKDSDDGQYWLLATLGEAALVRAQWAEAEDWYRKAAAVVQDRFAELASTRRNARLIAHALGDSRAHVDSFFNIPKVVIFTGHMIDSPERVKPRFPPHLEQAVREAIGERLIKIGAGFGYSSAACGADIIFLEVLNQLGGETHIVLPYNRDQFVEDSVDIIPNAGWKERFESVLHRGTSVLTASEQRIARGYTSYEYANQLIQGLARIKAEQLETELLPLAVWDGGSGDGVGGTMNVVEEWRKNGLDVELIDLAEILRQDQGTLKTDSAIVKQSSFTPVLIDSYDSKIMSMFFADAVNFSKLTEAQLPLFLRHFLGMIGDLTSSSPNAPIMKNTWGDGLFFVFTSVREAGNFALELCARLSQINWAQRGLPEDINLRIALHTGPVYECLDPVTGRVNFFGTHVNRTARIEAITPPGQVYSSQGFAALAAAQGVKDFKCDYVGQTALAKKFGTFPTYHVHPI